MPSLSARIFTLVFMAWANIYCCCTAAPAQAASLNKSVPDRVRPHCCSDKPAEPAPQQQHRPQHNKDCDECPFLAIRQTTVLSPGHHDDTIAPPASPCLFAEPIAPAVLASAAGPHCTSTNADESITIPHALVDLRTSLLR